MKKESFKQAEYNYYFTYLSLPKLKIKEQLKGYKSKIKFSIEKVN